MSLRIGSVLFVVTCVAQLAYPASMIGGHERILRAGTPVRIRCQTVGSERRPARSLRATSPRDLHGSVEKPEDYHASSTVYALLETDAEGFARLGGIRNRAPETGLYVRAQVREVNAETKDVIVGLPFDRYYMDEYDAPRAENAYRSGAGKGDAFVVLRVKEGRAAIEDLFVAADRWGAPLRPGALTGPGPDRIR